MSAYKPLLLRLHRWIALAFSLPLAGVILTGLILSLEPAVSHGAIRPGSVSADAVRALLDRVDPQGKARALVVRPLENAVAVSTGGRPGSAPLYDLTTGEAREAGSTSALVFGTSRRIHETLLIDSRLVEASTIAMLILIALGLLMGWWRLTNSVSGWHRAAGWLPLPLVIASPLTGLFIAWGVTFSPPAPPITAAPTLREAVGLVAAEKDLSSVVWMRPQGGRLVVRLWDGGELRAYGVTTTGLVALPRNWPRLIHEGNWAGSWSAGLNVALSAAFVTLLGSGLVIWARRKLRRRRRHAPSRGTPQPA